MATSKWWKEERHGVFLDYNQNAKDRTIAGAYSVRGEVVTPMLLARRFILNPVLVIVSLFFWYWMWGIAGALLAVPMLATVKIICDRVRPLMALGHFLGAEARN